MRLAKLVLKLTGQSLTRGKNIFLFSRSKLRFRNVSSVPLLPCLFRNVSSKTFLPNFFLGGKMRKRLLRRRSCSEKQNRKHILNLYERRFASATNAPWQSGGNGDKRLRNNVSITRVPCFCEALRSNFTKQLFDQLVCMSVTSTKQVFHSSSSTKCQVPLLTILPCCFTKLCNVSFSIKMPSELKI